MTAYATPSRFFLLDLADAPNPFDQALGVLLPELLELFGVKISDRGLHLLHGRFEFGSCHGLPGCLPQHLDGGGRSCPGGKEAGPDVEFDVLIAQFFQGGHIGKRGKPLVSPAREDPEGSCFQMGHHRHWGRWRSTPHGLPEGH